MPLFQRKESLEQRLLSVANLADRRLRTLGIEQGWLTALTTVRLPSTALAFLETATLHLEASQGEVYVTHAGHSAFRVGKEVGLDTFSIDATLEDWLRGMLLAGNVLPGLGKVSRPLAGRLPRSSDEELRAAVCACALAMLRRFTTSHESPPIEIAGFILTAFGQSTDRGAEEFSGLWRQLKADERRRSGTQNEPIFTLATIEASMGLLPLFRLQPGSLPVQGLYEWYQAGGQGLLDYHAGIDAATHLSNAFWAEFGGTCAAVASFAIQRAGSG